MSLLLNGYPLDFNLKKLERVSRTFQCTTPKRENYSIITRVILAAEENRKKTKLDFNLNIPCHLSFCKGIRDFSSRSHKLWDDCFWDTAISRIHPIVGFKKLNDLQESLVKKKRKKSSLKINE